MLSANTIKKIKSLSNKKYRKIHGEFIAEGEKVVWDILNEGKFEPINLYSVKGIIEEFKPLSANIIEVTEKELERISALKTPNKILGTFIIPDTKFSFKELRSRLILALDKINDPGNFGTIIRIADWFGIRDIVCSIDCVDLYNPKVIQATMGSIARLNVHYCDLEETILQLRNNNLDIFGTYIEGDNIYEQKLPDKGVIVIGSESHGISEGVSKLVNRRIHIPSFNPGSKIDSLNASIATALVCSEFKRSSKPN